MWNSIDLKVGGWKAALTSWFLTGPGWLLVLGLGGGALTLSAAPPPNDTCAGAEVIPEAGPFPYLSSITPDLTEATVDDDPFLPDPSAPGKNLYPTCLPFVSRSVWYTFTPSRTALYRLSVAGDTATTVIDTVMGLYTSPTGCGGARTNFVEVDCNDDQGLGDHATKSAILANLSAGTKYYILVWVIGDFPPDPGYTAVQLRVSQPVLPPNDGCAGALVIPGSGPFPYLTTTVDTLLATQMPGEPVPNCLTAMLPPKVAERSVWYRFTPAQTTFYSFSTCRGTSTTLFDSAIAVFTAPSGCTGPFLTYGCNDDGCGLSSNVRANLSAGVTYYIAVYDTLPEPGFAETDVQLRVTIEPEAITLAATSITSTGAVLNALIRPNGGGSVTLHWFEWGLDLNYEFKTPNRLSLSSVPEVAFSWPITNIQANLLYHYRAVATNANGMAFGEDRTFLWSSSQPQLEGITVPVNGGAFQFYFFGVAGQVYRVERSVDLIHWVDMGQPAMVFEGVYEFSDPDPPVEPARFYRLRSP